MKAALAAATPAAIHPTRSRLVNLLQHLSLGVICVAVTTCTENRPLELDDGLEQTEMESVPTPDPGFATVDGSASTVARVLLLHGDSYYNSVDPGPFVRDRLVETGVFQSSEIEVRQMSESVPAASDLANYDCVITWNNTPWPISTPIITAHGDLLRDYVVQEGGGVVLLQATFYHAAAVRLTGGIMESGFNPLQPLDNPTFGPEWRRLDFSTALPNHPILDGVGIDFAWAGHLQTYTPTIPDAGASVVARDDFLADPLIAVNASGNVVAINLYPAHGWAKTDPVYRAISNACVFAGKALNSAPVVTGIALPTAPVALGGAASMEATFSDLNVEDVHSAVVDWGDGISTAGSVTENGGFGTVSASRTYEAPGVYTVTVSVSDGDDVGSRVSSDDSPSYIVVYDPTGGFVTGGGWIQSPPGAYAPDPMLAGKASFGFVSKYQKGANVPTGKTQFQFHAAGFDFRSTSYDWLVVAGPKAQYKGLGTVNGAGSYGFMLTAIDGQVNGGGGTDRFRLKVWERSTDAVVYDSELGASDDTSPATALGGGSIVIHSK